MNLVVILGSGAVGKMTVGQELQKITDYRLFHNHIMIEPVIEVFGGFHLGLVNKLREDVMEAFIATDYSGLIVTYMMAFDFESEWEYINNLKERFETTGGEVYFVELVADQDVRLKRNGSENRLKNKASKRDITISNDRLKNEDSNYRLVSNDGEFPYENYIKIDNTNIEPDVVAKMIKERFNLANYCYKDQLRHFALAEVKEEQLEFLLKLQKNSFLPLYAKYNDEINPALETIEQVKERFNTEGRTYYFICKDGAVIGGVNIDLRQYKGEGYGRISPIFINPEHQNKGNGFIAILKIFDQYKDIRRWQLETIKEEAGNCHLYEKLGFKRIGVEHRINDKMTIIDYELVLE